MISRDDSNRSKIIHATLKLAEKEGWDSVSTRRVAKEVGYSTTVIYHNFGSKARLLEEIQIEGFKEMREQFERIIDQVADPAQQLLAISLFHFDFAMRHQLHYQAMFNLEGVKVGGSEHHKDQIAAGDLVRGVLKKLSNDSPLELFLNWWAIVHGTIVIQLNDSMKTRPDDIKTMLSEFIRRFIRGLKRG